VAEIMRERHGFGEILIDAKAAGHRARDLRDLERMGEARAVMIAFMGDENLRFLFQAAEPGRMDDPVAIALKRRAGGRFSLLMEAPPEFSHSVANTALFSGSAGFPIL